MILQRLLSVCLVTKFITNYQKIDALNQQRVGKEERPGIKLHGFELSECDKEGAPNKHRTHWKIYQEFKDDKMPVLHIVTLSDNTDAGYRYSFDVTTTMMPK